VCIFISAIYEAVLTAARRTPVFAIHDLEKLQQAFEIQATNTGSTVCFQHATNVTERFQPQNDARGRGHRVNTRIQNAAKLSFSIFFFTLFSGIPRFCSPFAAGSACTT